MGNCMQTAPKDVEYDTKKTMSSMTPITSNHTDYKLAISIQNGLYGSLSSSTNDQSVSPQIDDIKNQCTEKIEHILNEQDIFTEYAPEIFSKLRESFGISDDVFSSILTGKDNKLLSFLSNSKSGNYFFFSNNSQFIIKTMSKSELEYCLEILSSYYQYMIKEKNSLIARFYGIYTLNKFKMNNNKNSTKDISFLISNNIFYCPTNISIKYQYDLKGSTQGRKTDEIKEKSGEILKDLNFIENDVRMEISRDNKSKIFHQQIFKDCQWFEKHLIMDYSLLVGIANVNHIKNDSDIDNDSDNEIKSNHSDNNNNNNNNNIFYQYHGGILSDNKKEIYYLGIIDILQKYNKKKKMAAFVKGIKYEQITLSTVPPDIYSKRFCQFFKDRVL